MEKPTLPTLLARRDSSQHFIVWKIFKVGFISLLICLVLWSTSNHLVRKYVYRSTPDTLDVLNDIAKHCERVSPTSHEEYLQRQKNLAQILYELDAAAYVAEPGAEALYYANLSGSVWGLSERPLLLMISPSVHGESVEAKVTILTPKFEETRARLLVIPGNDIQYAPWPEDMNPFSMAVQNLWEFSGSNIYVDGNVRKFIADGLQDAAPCMKVASAPLEIRQLRERKSPSELELLKCANEATLLAIRAVRSQLYFGIHESQARKMIEDTLFAAGLTNLWVLVLFGENAALPHGGGTDRVLGRSDLVLIDAGGALHGYQSDVTRTFALLGSTIPENHLSYWKDVRSAQTAALQTAKAGAVTWSVDAAARNILRAEGLDTYFTHRLGHGIGLETHEAPYLRGGSKDIIQIGHTFSDEPGVYIEGVVGIRLEDCFYINEQGDAVYLTEGVGGQARSIMLP